MNGHPFLSLQWILWLVVLVWFSVIAFGTSGLAFLCGFRENSALRAFSGALTRFKKNPLKVTLMSLSILVFLMALFYLIQAPDHGRWFDFANNLYLNAFGVCWVIANDTMQKTGHGLHGL
ncbi:hypothetical protein SAMN05421799_10539 [Alicyclobacillus vulcanalis]|uniref:Uncharacterized protein n=1 Tax=Alicyclobacillus vulcanalis TaxID=252246 RepID=A0A1N7MBV5_9BACL|nr:hypothetical protein SAMN05421799_10539 [Alicyclobacillus vulcanalis]